MLMKPRLSLFEAQTFGQKMKYGMLQKMFGMLPAAVHVMSANTRLDRSGFKKNMLTHQRTRSLWTRAERECFAAFISYLNHCKF